jgi:subtilisin family serine protease
MFSSLLVFLLVWCCSTVKITSHSDGGILRMMADPYEWRDSLWMINIMRAPLSDGGVADRKTMTLVKKALHEDQCLLLKDFTSVVKIAIKVHCNQTNERKKEGWTWEQPPVLVHTLDKLLYGMYGREHVHLGFHIEVRSETMKTMRPEFFLGSHEYLNSVMNFQLQSEEVQAELAFQHPYLSRPLNLLLGADSLNVETAAPWGLDRIDQRSLPLDTLYHYQYTAPDVDIYIIDTGILTTNTDFGGRAIFLFNAVGDGIDSDCNGHGTHVAGIAGSNTYGVAKGATLYAVKVLDCTGNGDLFTIQAGIDEVIENSQVNTSRRTVVNLSLGGARSTLLDQAVLNLTQYGIFVSVSAGNDASDACQYSPSALGGSGGGVASVGASTQTDQRSSFSNFGSCVDISAPGSGILSTYVPNPTSTTTLSGTSMSSPFVGGVAALVFDQNPALSPSEVKTVIKAWATPNIISGATVAGGGKNLLFSLVANTAITEAPTAPNTPPVPVPVPVEAPGDGLDFSGAPPLTVLSLLTCALIPIMILL